MNNKKMMKKTAGFLACLALAASMPTAAFAAAGSGSITGDEREQKIDVKVTYRSETTWSDVYSVDVEWEDMTFSYKVVGEKEWNPDTHTYKETTDGGWVKDTADITVTNHSNTDIAVTVAYQRNNAIVDASITNETFTIESAVEKAVDAPELKKTATLTISGKPTYEDIQDTKVGTVTVTIK